MRVLAMVVMAALMACSRSPRGPVVDRNVIRANEIASVEAASAYDIVAKLRAEYLRSRGPTSAARGRVTQPPIVTVFVDGVEAGPADRALVLIPAAEVREIRMHRPGDATTKYGTRHSGGVLEVTTVRTKRP